MNALLRIVSGFDFSAFLYPAEGDREDSTRSRYPTPKSGGLTNAGRNRRSMQ